ncbi:hypothetical protein SteCoe_18527 [Stentor coeruleus]|uniref:G domain-containing protein n=1 Tax=Stentor coeruleus TaxID=5963 RepID=A0A1R2BWJ3_9CILI|nr:hypothetical protein SteCoe_18527 [Stentor coeruleus]
MLKIFKESLLDIIKSTGHLLPIISSIGKSNCGKSYFLRHLLQESSISVRSEQTTQGTLCFWSKEYRNFRIFDMEGLFANDKDNRMNILNMCSSFSFSDIILLHISHDDLENRIFLEKFSFNYLQSAKICLKYKKNLPEIILLIRDPRWKSKNIQNKSDYEDLVIRFTEKVNWKIREFLEKFELLFDAEASKGINVEENKEESFNATNALSENIDQYFLRISEFYCIYHEYNFTEQTIEYFEFVEEIGKLNYVKSLFGNILEKLIIKCTEIQQKKDEELQFKSYQICNVTNEITFKMSQMIYLNEENTQRVWLMNSIYSEILYNVFICCDNETKQLTFLRNYSKLATSINSINDKIIGKITNKVDENEIIKFRNAHEKEINMLFADDIENADDLIQLIKYFKYLSAISFCNSFELTKDSKNSLSYDCLFSIVRFQSEESYIFHHFMEIQKNLLAYRCLFYVDSEFYDIVKLIMPRFFLIFSTYLEIYKDYIDFTLDLNYKYKDVALCQIDKIKCIDIIRNLKRLYGYFEDYLDLNFEGLFEFQEYLKEFHTNLLTEKAEKLQNESFKLKIEYYEKIEQFSISSRLYRFLPSLSVIAFGLAGTAASRLNSHISGNCFSYILPLCTFSTGLVFASLNYFSSDLKNIMFSHTCGKFCSVIDSIIIKDYANVTHSNENSEIFENSFIYKIRVERDKKNNKSGCIKIACFVVCRDLEDDAIRNTMTQIEDQYDFLNPKIDFNFS